MYPIKVEIGYFLLCIGTCLFARDKRDAHADKDGCLLASRCGRECEECAELANEAYGTILDVNQSITILSQRKTKMFTVVDLLNVRRSSDWEVAQPNTVLRRFTECESFSFERYTGERSVTS